MNETSGQWIGSTTYGTSVPQFTLVNIEDRNRGRALVVGIDQHSGHRSVSHGVFSVEGDTLSGETHDIRIFDHKSNSFIPVAEFQKSIGYTGPAPTKLQFTGTILNDTISGTFTNDIGECGTFELRRRFRENGREVDLQPAEGPMPWEEFKKRIATFKFQDEVVFRGQDSNLFPLKTLFHRCGRNNMSVYLSDDVVRLRHHVNAISAYHYSNSVEDLHGLLSLAQHHGFPTPLLDWTRSPYVAAFFAFDLLCPPEHWLKSLRNPVRIFVFDRAAWTNVPRNKASSIIDPWPDFQFFEPPAHNNPRYYPQQSIAAFSDVDDIEAFIASVEARHNRQFVSRFDIHATERQCVESDLRFMGITASTLFPGIEGACRSLRTQLFAA